MFTYLAIDIYGSKKVYTGSTVDFEKRQKSHLNSKENYPFQNALKVRPFYWICSEDDGLEDRSEEQTYLDFYFGSEWSFNLNPNAVNPPNAPETLPESWKKSISRGRQGVVNSSESYQKGWETRRLNGRDKPTSETKEKMQKSHTGRKHSDESKLKRSNTLRGREGTAKGWMWFVNLLTKEVKKFNKHPGDGWVRGRKLK
jgi:hypothetical protein